MRQLAHLILARPKPQRALVAAKIANLQEETINTKWLGQLAHPNLRPIGPRLLAETKPRRLLICKRKKPHRPIGP